MAVIPLELEQVGAVTVVRIGGKRLLDDGDVDRLKRDLLQLAGDPGRCRMVLDFREVEALSSTVLAALLVLRKALLSRGGRLALCSLRDGVREVFAITGLERALHVYPTEQEALQSF
jgi:anti-sigma B factor antagonist